MQLTLVDTILFGCSHNGMDLVSFGEVAVRPAPSIHVASHSVHKLSNLMSELITAEKCLLKVDVLFSLLSSNRTLRIRCTTPANNILQRLRERFREDIKVSLTIQKLQQNNPNISPLLCVEGMTINSATFKCETDVDKNRFPELGIPAVDNKVFGVQITASIPDEVLSIRQKPHVQPKMQITVPQKILENGIASDIVIIAGNGAEIKAHKSFLFAWSAAVEREFESGMMESQTGRHDMSDMSEPGIMAFLRYLYYEDLEGPNQSADIAYEMLYAAHKYEVTDLEELMQKQLLDKADIDFKALTALKIYCFLRNIDPLAQLKSKMIGILKMKIDEVHALSEYKELFQKNPNNAMDLCYQLAKATLK